MKLTICGGPNDLCCTTENLNSWGDDFQSWDYDQFTEESLGDCYQFPIKSPNDTSIQIHHEGFDGVDIKYWEIIFDVGKIAQCIDGHFYDRDDTNTVTCY